MLAQKLSENPFEFIGPWNFGPNVDDNLTVHDVVKKAIEVWGNGNFVIANLATQPHEAGILKLDITKSLTKLKWKPKWDANLAIYHTIDWYKKQKTGIDAKTIMLNQLKKYMNV